MGTQRPKENYPSHLSVPTVRPQHGEGKDNEIGEEFILQTTSQVGVYFPESGEILR